MTTSFDTYPPRVLVIGATGLVGRELLGLMQDRALPLGGLRLAASPASLGTEFTIGDHRAAVESFSPTMFDASDLAFFCAGGSFSREHADAALQAGCTVIDLSSAFRMADDVPLVVPEINPDALAPARTRPTLIANPNCSTTIALMAVTPLHRAVPVRRMIVSTYQAISGGGAAMLNRLESEADAYRSADGWQPEGERPLLFNVFSHDSPVGDCGYNEEELKLLNETHKIWNETATAITATCVRVPVLRTHCESINLEFTEPMPVDRARELLAAAPGVRIVDDREQNQFPEPRHASGGDDVLVGRIRTDRSRTDGCGLELFVAGDQLRKGAALNAIQIAEALCRSLQQA